MSRIFKISEIGLDKTPQNISTGRILVDEGNVFYGYWEAYHAKYFLSGVIDFGVVSDDRSIAFFQIPDDIKSPLSMYVEPWNDAGRWFTLHGNGYLDRMNGKSKIELEELTNMPYASLSHEDEIKSIFENIDVTVAENVAALTQTPLLINVIVSAELAAASTMGELERWKFW